MMSNGNFVIWSPIGCKFWKPQQFAVMAILMTELAAIILAAGKGTRMKSDLHKVLHPIAGRPMLMHLMDAVDALSPTKKVVVVGSGKEQLEAALAASAHLAVQEPQHGTGHAVQQAQGALEGFEGDVLILYGDVPFVPTATMQAMVERLNAPDAPAVVVLAFEPEDPTGYGRVIVEDGRIVKMVEQKDATDVEKAVKLSNSGLMAVKARDLFPLLDRVTDDNAQKEFYLTDIVNIANADGRMCVAVTTDPFDVAGINSRAQLAEMEQAWQQRRRAQAMDDGATLIAPETVWFAWDTKLGGDVLIEPNVFFGPGVSVADNVKIRANSHIEGAQIASGCEVGPFARLRPGTVLEEKAKIGNFVETKKAHLGKGAKANHLTYLGDATIGAGANIGAGTITCNYDGYFKYQTVIGEGAFIGSNSALIAPVKIGRDAIVAAGSAVSRDVADGELRMVRAEQLVKPGWADRFHDAMRKKKEGK
jgi:bifunctional UDP-N-acetylglucosamine pyrophosphorylase/glucosamine-1-phosphate N-acetyltransferase